MNHGSLNNYPYNADNNDNSNSNGLLTYAAASQQPTVAAKHLPYLSSHNVSSPPANGDMSTSSQTNLFFNNFFGSNHDLPKNSSLAQSTATTNAKQQQHAYKHAAFAASSPSRMADAGEQPQTTDTTISINETLHKLRQKLGGTSASSSVHGGVTNNPPTMLLHDVPDYSTRFPHYSTTTSLNNSNNVYNANNVNGNTNIRWGQPGASEPAASSSPAYASSRNSRQSGGDNGSRAAEQLPLLPATTANKFSFSSSSSKQPAPQPPPSNTATVNTKTFSSAAFTLQQQQQQPSQHNPQPSSMTASSVIKPHHNTQTVTAATTKPTSSTRYAAELASEKLPQLCALANSLQSVSSTSLINNNHNNNNNASYYHSPVNEAKYAASDTDAVYAAAAANSSSSRKPDEFSIANANLSLPKLLSKLTGSTTGATTRKRSMNEESNAPAATDFVHSSSTAGAADSAQQQQHCSGPHGCGVHAIPAAAVAAASSGVNNNNHHHQQPQHPSDETTTGTTQKKSRFRIGSLAINRKSSVVAADAPVAAPPVQQAAHVVVSAVHHQQHAVHTLPALHTTNPTVLHHAAKTSNENFDSIIPAASSSGHQSKNSLLSSSSKIGVDDSDQQQLSPRNRVMSPNTAIRKYGSRLSNYELGEIKNYSRIYFVGQRADKIDASSTKSRNYGYDNEDGLYLLRRRDQIAYRFEIIDKLGQGSFGQVVRAYDHKDGIEVALKILRNRRKFYRQGLVEVKLLEIVKRKDNAHNTSSSSDPSSSLHNVVHMLNHFIFRNHLCISFELLGSNLYEVLQKNHFQGFNVKAVRNIAHQILACLQLLRRERIIHCDLKPENILINPNKPDSIAVKVVDFGSGCLDNQKLYTYIQSRYYRSPEVIMGLAYTMAIDMWSLGCILSELHTGRPLFPGEDEDEQLSMMMEVLGIPPQGVIAQGTRSSRFFDSCGQPIRLVNSRGRKRVPASKELSRAICAADKSFVDFLLKSFSYDADTRLTPDEGLRHEFIAPPPTAAAQHSSSSSGGASTSRQSAGGALANSSSTKVAATKNWASTKSGR